MFSQLSRRACIHTWDYLVKACWRVGRWLSSLCIWGSCIFLIVMLSCTQPLRNCYVQMFLPTQIYDGVFYPLSHLKAVLEARIPRWRWQCGQVLVRPLFLTYRRPSSRFVFLHMLREREGVGENKTRREEGLSGVSLQGTDPITKAPPSWPPLNLINSQNHIGS